MQSATLAHGDSAVAKKSRAKFDPETFLANADGGFASADVTMSAEDDITSSMDAHVREISEAASGGLSGGGGGCGCN